MRGGFLGSTLEIVLRLDIGLSSYSVLVIAICSAVLPFITHWRIGIIIVVKNGAGVVIHHGWSFTIVTRLQRNGYDWLLT